MSTARPTTLCEAFQRVATRAPDAVALRSADGATTITWRQYAGRVRTIAGGLAALGLERGDTVALMLTNRPEFHLCDTAVLHAGATPFSVYNTNPADTLAYQFENAGNRIVICEKQFFPVVLAAAGQGGTVEHVICVDDAPDGALSLNTIESNTASTFDFDASWQAVQPDDLLTIVYTSGTTGPPKGVELTHTNFIENARITDDFGGVDATDRAISYLPDAHAANRWFAHYTNLLHGVPITTVPDVKLIIAALTEIRPTAFLGVPRIWVKLKAALEQRIADEPNPAKRALAQWAFATGRAKARADSEGRSLGSVDTIRYTLADRMVLSKVRRQLGLDQVRIAVTGAAPIPPEVHEFVLGLGVPLCEGWGMSECTAAVTVNRPNRIKIGTVGIPVPGAEIRIAEDGEVLVRGPMVMRGYRKSPEKTSEAIDSNGWLSTGDIGSIDIDGFLSIVDRKKELIINAAGKNMSPTNIENVIASNCPLVGTVIVIGDARLFNTALICLDRETAATFAAKNKLEVQSVADLATHAAIRDAVAAGITSANAKLSRVEQVKKYTILSDTWEPGSDYLTPTNKLRRKPIIDHYADTIDRMYKQT
ncbi:long-chain fatty acid--CoA ligase [Rhodococcus erythropolis]|uniref:AMP-dependent synthetase/ligase n=1 Tax=Rhodococcus erythropolis TaxID=1833 RepID=UPI0008A3A3D3|nr:long-chain fatty acid--CoA ligase [Rhodococcus erythropolis]MBT1258540.1 long-chain fatty acid--CoA ligase [Rhodococcus erythropolis]OHF24836.1 long-chain fatty acid--CoA ligase [Rhodococcus erythropolis]